MKDVAKEAGVALGTVSKVFNGIPVGEPYRIKVEEAAQRLGYKINSYARSLKTNKKSIIAVILPTVAHPFFGLLAEYCSRILKKRGYHMLLSTTDFNPDAEKDCILMVQQNIVDGIICLSYSPELEITSSIPFVSIDRYFNASVPCVSSDNFGGGQLAAQKLVEFGCKKLLFLRSASPVIGEVDKRQLGFDSFCNANNIQHESMIVYEPEGFQKFFTFLDSHIRNGKLEYDGIFCGTDHLAVQVVRYLRSRGIRIPEDVQLIGYDGIWNHFEEDFFCSTIVQPVEAMVQACVDILLAEDPSNLPPLMCLPVSYGYGGTTIR